MYQLSLTANQHHNHVRVVFTLVEILEDGGRRIVIHDVMTVPELGGGLFESGPEDFSQSVFGWLRTTRREFVDTDE